MHSLDEPLDLKLSISKLRNAREKRERGPPGPRPRVPPSAAAPPPVGESRGSARGGRRAGPGPGLLAHSKALEKRFPALPVMDLSLSPPPGVESPGGGSASLSPERHGDPPVPAIPHDFQSLRYIDGIPGSFQFFLPLGAGGALHLPSFLPPPKDKRLSPELPLPKQLVCRWSKCNQFFDLLQDLVDHVNDFHVKPEKDAGYCCHWEGCARHGRGFNARYKMLIHIRTHTNEKPHRCPTCNKSFSRLENLKIHNRSHTGEKPYICPYEGCNKRYSNSSDRFKHTRTHYVEKPYYCKMPGCHKRYTDPSSLRKHIKAHGHFVSHEHHEMLKPKGSADAPYANGAQLLLPNPAALFAPHALPALPLPLAPAPLDLSALGCGAGGSLPALPGPALPLNGGGPLNLAKAPLLPSPFAAGGLGLPVMSLLAGGAKAEADEAEGRKGGGKEGRKAGGQRTEPGRLRAPPESLALLPGAVLDLSMGVGAAGSPPEALPPGWVVIPPGSLLLKPAVVN